MAISGSEFLKWLEVFGVQMGGGGGSVTPADIQNSSFIYSFDNTGTGDAIVATLNPAVTSLTDGMMLICAEGGAYNATTSPTISVNGLTPVPVKVNNTISVNVNDIGGEVPQIYIYSESAQVFNLINPLSFATFINAYLTGDVFFGQDNIGVANTYGASLGPDFGGAATSQLGMFFYLNPFSTNTGASTFNLNGTGAVSIVDNATSLPLTANQIQQGTVAEIFNDGSVWRLMNPAVPSVTSANGTGTALTSGTPANITSLTLTAGAQNRFCLVSGIFNTTSGNINQLSVCLSQTSSTLANPQWNLISSASTLENPAAVVPPLYLTVPANTSITVYLVANAVFTATTCSVAGTITAIDL